MSDDDICPRCRSKLYPGCDSWGNIPISESVARECPNMKIARVAAALGAEIRKAKHIHDSPLVGLHDEDLFIRVRSWGALLPHLKASLGYIILRQTFRFALVTDQRIKAVFVGEEAFKYKSFEDRSQYNNGLTDLLGSQDLVIIRLGFLGYTNRAAAGAIKESLLIRNANRLPTWIVEAEQKFEECYSYSEELLNFINANFGLIELDQVKDAPPKPEMPPGVELEEEESEQEEEKPEYVLGESLTTSKRRRAPMSQRPAPEPFNRSRKGKGAVDDGVAALESMLGSKKR